MKSTFLKVLGNDLETIGPNTSMYYPFDEGAGDIVKDYSKNANWCTLENGTKFGLSADGKSALIFDGINDCIEDLAGMHIVDAGTMGAWSKVIISNETKIVGDGTKFCFANSGELTGEFISNFTDYCPNLTYFRCTNNQFSGTLPSFAALENLTGFYCDSNAFTGALPSFNNLIELTDLKCNNNMFGGALPSFDDCIAIKTVRVHTNNFNGEFPSFAHRFLGLESTGMFLLESGDKLIEKDTCINLEYISLHTNSFSGTLPSFNLAGSKLMIFYCYGNSFTGTLPSFANCTDLTNFWAYSNSFDAYENGSFATQPNLCKVWLQGNAIDDSTYIDDILRDLRTSYNIPGRVACNVKLEGGTMAIPTEEGVGFKDFLNNHGWTVTTNEGGD